MALRFYQNQSHNHQEEKEMAKADVLAFLLSGWQENGQMITISLSTHHKTWRISKILYHSSWPYGLSSLLTDYIKSKHFNSKVWFALYMQPKVFWITFIWKNVKKVFFYVSILSLLFLKKIEYLHWLYEFYTNVMTWKNPFGFLQHFGKWAYTKQKPKPKLPNDQVIWPFWNDP